MIAAIWQQVHPVGERDAIDEVDVSMGAFVGAEVCELAGLFILNQLGMKLDVASVGL